MCFPFSSTFGMESAAANRRPQEQTPRSSATAFPLGPKLRTLPVVHSPRQTPPRLHPLSARLPLKLTSEPDTQGLAKSKRLRSRNVDLTLGCLRGLEAGSEMNGCHGGDEPPGPLQGARGAGQEAEWQSGLLLPGLMQLQVAGDRGSEGGYPSLGPLFEGESCIRETQNIKPKEITAFELFTCLSTCLPCLSQTCGHPTADTLQVDFPIEILHLKTFNFDVFFRVQWAQMKDALRDVSTGEPQMTLGTEGWSRPVWRRWPFLQLLPQPCRAPFSELSIAVASITHCRF